MEHIWKIYDLKRIIADGMVTQVTYACESELEGNGTRTIGDITLTTGSSSDDDFVSYDSLTQNVVLGWITGSIDTTSIETSNSSSIALKISASAAIVEANGTPW